MAQGSWLARLMLVLDGVSLVFAFVAVGLAGMIKATIGFGFPLVVVPALSNVLDARTTVLAVSVPAMLSNLLIVLRGGGSWAGVRRLGLVIVSLAVGTLMGAQLLALLDARLLSVLVGGFATGFAALSASRADVRITPKLERYASPVVGVLSGVLGGTTNIFGPILASYLHSLRFSKQEFVFLLSLLFAIGGVTQVVSYSQLGLYTAPILTFGLLACVPMVLGLYLGLKVQRLLSGRVWNITVLVFIFISGLSLIARGILG